MKITSDTLKRIAAMPEQAMAAALLFLAEQLEADEAKRAIENARGARYRANGGGNIPHFLRMQVYERDEFACVYCGSTEDLSCDHDIPVSKGGPTTYENLVTACRPCNSRKRDRDRKAFTRELARTNPDKSADKLGHNADVSGQNRDNGGITPLARVEYNNNLPTELDNKNLSLTLSKPLRANGTNPRAMGTNPRATGTNPRADASEAEGFSEFWETYPKRDGSADRKGAEKAFRAALKRADITTIIDGAQHFSEAMTARGKAGTEFVPQARTWLNGDRWNERYDAAGPSDNKAAQNLAILEKYRASPRS